MLKTLNGFIDQSANVMNIQKYGKENPCGICFPCGKKKQKKKRDKVLEHFEIYLTTCFHRLISDFSEVKTVVKSEVKTVVKSH